jgi:hypothetical protein
MLAIPSAPSRLAQDAVERAFLGLRPHPYLDLAAQHCAPGRVLFLGRVDPDAAKAAFPGADRRWATTDGPWSPPDLVISHLALRRRGLDTAQVVDQIWRALPDGGHVLVVDLHRVRFDGLRRSVEQTLSIDVSDPLLERLRQAFVPLHLGIQQHLGGLWSTFVFVGRKGCRYGF